MPKPKFYLPKVLPSQEQVFSAISNHVVECTRSGFGGAEGARGSGSVTHVRLPVEDCELVHASIYSCMETHVPEYECVHLWV